MTLEDMSTLDRRVDNGLISKDLVTHTLSLKTWSFCDKVVFVSGERPTPWRSWVSAAGRQSQGEDSISLKIDCCYMMNHDDIPHINKAVGVATRSTKAHKWNSRSGSSFDILESTAWIREVVVHSQKKRKGWCHQKYCYCNHQWQNYFDNYFFPAQELASSAVSASRLLVCGRGLKRFIKSPLVISIKVTIKRMRFAWLIKMKILILSLSCWGKDMSE